MHRFEAFHRMLDHAKARRGVAIMGVCNVTPDSFSDGGRFFAADAARARVDALVAEGADVIDVGGESTRPGAEPVPPEEQWRRVADAVRHAVERGACVSIDTASPEVASRCLDAGACVVNDASCLRDRALAEVTASGDAALVLMHTRGEPARMRDFGDQRDDAYGDVVDDVMSEWTVAADAARGAGVRADAIAMDPGLGFAKSGGQSTELLRRIGEIVRRAGVPVVVGASRKSFLKVVDRDAAADQRLGASLAAALHAWRRGASIVRVHDVRATRQAIDLERELDRGGG